MRPPLHRRPVERKRKRRRLWAGAARLRPGGRSQPRRAIRAEARLVRYAARPVLESVGGEQCPRPTTSEQRAGVRHFRGLDSVSYMNKVNVFWIDPSPTPAMGKLSSAGEFLFLLFFLHIKSCLCLSSLFSV